MACIVCILWFRIIECCISVLISKFMNSDLWFNVMQPFDVSACLYIDSKDNFSRHISRYTNVYLALKVPPIMCMKLLRQSW